MDMIGFLNPYEYNPNNNNMGFLELWGNWIYTIRNLGNRIITSFSYKDNLELLSEDFIEDVKKNFEFEKITKIDKNEIYFMFNYELQNENHEQGIIHMQNIMSLDENVAQNIKDFLFLQYSYGIYEINWW